MFLAGRSSLLEIHLATVLFGLAGLFGKWLVFSPPLIVLGRVFFASLALGTVLWWKRQNLRDILRTQAGLLVLLGAILAVHWGAFFQAIQVSSVAVGLLSYSCFPVFTVLLEPLFSREKLDWRSLSAAGICLAGVLLIVPRFDLADSVFQGVLWGLLSGLSFAVLTMFNRRLVRDYSSLAIAFFQDLFAAFFLLPSLMMMAPAGLAARDLGLLVVLGVVCTAGSHTLFIRGMRRVRARTASIISSLEPVYGIVLAFVFLGESPSFRTLTGGAVIMAAVIFVTLREGARHRD
ncbi:MAG TPA: DMT family transporter [Candidatus Desulfaltia sp.]|nr:DMT family transporter [Candidatus Desulfaltia sp.]